MLATLLPAALAARAEHADGSLPPVAVVLRRHGALADAEPVAATLEPHPRLRVLLNGARRTRSGWSLPASRAAKVMAAIGHPWHASGRLAQVSKTSTGIRLTVKPVADSVLGRLTAAPGTSVAVTAADAHALVDQARRHHLPVFTLLSPAELKVVDEDAVNTVVATCPAGMPAIITLSGPATAMAKLTLPADDLTSHTRKPKKGEGPAVRTAAAMSAFKASAGVRLLWREDAADAVAVAAAAPVNRSRPQLHPWQASFAGRYAASARGMVNALPPGLGKSAAALAALRAIHNSGNPIRALLLAPTSSRHQWLDEATQFFPEARVVDAGTGAALTEALLAPSTPADLILTTPDLLAAADTAQGTWTDVVVDEATMLTQQDARRAQAAWHARRSSLRGMPLTGTPRPRRLADLEALVCFALGETDLFSDLPLSGYDAVDPISRLGAFVHTHDAPTSAARAEHECAALPATAVERILDDLVRERIGDLTARRDAGAALTTLLKAARLGYSDPTALVSSSYRLGRDLADRLAEQDLELGPAPSTKVQFVAAEVARRVTAGEQVLVTGDFLDPLATLATLLRAELGTDAVQPVTSKVAPKTRERHLSGFSGGRVKVLLLSGTAHLGLNLQSASAVVHLDVPSTAALLTQRAARSARLGSTRASIASVLPVLDATVEDRLADLIGARGLRPADREDELAFAARLTSPTLRTAA